MKILQLRLIQSQNIYTPIICSFFIAWGVHFLYNQREHVLCLFACLFICYLFCGAKGIGCLLFVCFCRLCVNLIVYLFPLIFPCLSLFLRDQSKTLAAFSLVLDVCLYIFFFVCFCFCDQSKTSVAFSFIFVKIPLSSSPSLSLLDDFTEKYKKIYMFLRKRENITKY